MKNFLNRKIIIFSIVFILFVLFFSNQSRDSIIKPSEITPLKERKVLTYFYYWYDLPNGTHSNELTDMPVDKNTSYKNVDWFKKQLTDMEEAGIDVALIVYWSYFEQGYMEGLRNLIKARNNLLSERENSPQLGLFIDTGLFHKLKSRERNFTTQKGKKLFYSFIKEFFDEVSSEHRGLINKRPIIWFWGSWFPISYDQSTFDFVYSQFEKDFGVKPYIVREISWNYSKKKTLFGEKIDYRSPITTDDLYIWGASLDGFKQGEGNIASIGPGYDERKLSAQDRTGRYADRKNGEFYLENFQKALSSGKSILVIETWNEFHEANDIAESEEYGRYYINLTRDLSNHWKSR